MRYVKEVSAEHWQSGQIMVAERHGYGTHPTGHGTSVLTLSGKSATAVATHGARQIGKWVTCMNVLYDAIPVSSYLIERTETCSGDWETQKTEDSCD